MKNGVQKALLSLAFVGWGSQAASYDCELLKFTVAEGQTEAQVERSGAQVLEAGQPSELKLKLGVYEGTIQLTDLSYAVFLHSAEQPHIRSYGAGSIDSGSLPSALEFGIGLLVVNGTTHDSVMLQCRPRK